jgi:signal transduction histidine kinase
MSILVIDDYANSRLTLTAHLRAAGYADILTAESASKAYELLGIEDPSVQAVAIDLILMDIEMPEIDGIEACEKIKQCKRLQDIPIIMITSFEEVKYLEAALNAGAMDFMRKPVDHIELLARVRSALALKSEIDRRNEAFSALETQLLHSQRLEGFGRVAGGLAHDIRNVLTPVICYSQLGMSALSPDDPAHSKFQEILKAADHAADLTNRMLISISSRAGQAQATNLNGLIEETRNLLRSLIKESIDLTTSLDPQLGLVNVDPIIIQQLLMNLATNASDAMPNGGNLTIETTNVKIEEGYTYGETAVLPWDYVVVSVKDTGTGVPAEIRTRIFEPLFTTKEAGKGTGLGLANCVTIARECGGHIELFSEPGDGSTFRVFLPRFSGPPDRLPESEEPISLPRGTETILVAEDEPLVRVLITTILEDQGYTVLSATNGSEALRISEKQASNPIDLLLCDVVMPQMSGEELANQLMVSRPNIKVLLTSGYVENIESVPKTLGKGAAFMEKPFRPATLAGKIRDLLDP